MIKAQESLQELRHTTFKAMVPTQRWTSHRGRQCEIKTDHVTDHRRPDITVVDKDTQTALLIDIAMLGARMDENKTWH